MPGIRLRRVSRQALVLVLLACVPLASAGDVLTLGVFAYRPAEVLEPRYRPLADYLGGQLPGAEVRLRVLSQPEMERALGAGELDMLFTNPSHYTWLRSQNALTGALATLVSLESGQATDRLGGVIISQGGTAAIQDLRELRGRRIGAPGPNFLGGYQAQAFELLEAGVRLPRDADLVLLGSHDAVIRAVLEGRIEFGFVRTGVIEELEREGVLDPGQLKIVNEQHIPGFPYRLSTRLYPEWAFVALPHLDSRTVRRIASSLLGLEEDHPVARASGIGGFSPPRDYLPVENLARALRLPPFDGGPAVTLRDVWERWQAFWIALALGVTVLLSLAIWRLSSRNRQLVRLQSRQSQAEAAIRESEQRFRNLANSGSTLVWTSGLDRRCDYFNEPWLRFTGCSGQQALEQDWTGCVHPDDVERVRSVYAEAFARQVAFDIEYRLRHADGGYRWVRGEGRPRFDSDGRFIGYIGHGYDVTRQHEIEQGLHLAASVFEHARESIMITDGDGRIIDVNQAFTDMTGYAREEVLGRNPRMLASGLHDAGFFAAMHEALAAQGYWTGEIWNRRKGGEVYPGMQTISAVRSEDGTVVRYVSLSSDISAIKEQQRQLEHVAHYDPLTSLPNRVLLADRLQQAMARVQRHGMLLAVVYLDLDGFKAVNDSHGHKVGDHLLKLLAGRMQLALRDSDTLARFGGDEFVAVLPDLQGHDSCLPVLKRLLASAAEPVHTDGVKLQVSASLGVTFFPQTGDATDPDQLIRQADQAMYQAKQAGKNRYQVFDSAQDRALRGFHESAERIREAVKDGELELHYQPKVNMRTGAVIGVEALLRWRHPERGLLAPALFLPAIERHALSVEIGDWVLTTALNQVEAWRRTGLELPVSVNVNALQLRHPGFMDGLRAQLAAHPSVRPGDLQIEVLESNAVEDMARISEIMLACREIGIGCEIDDFGTGFSSLTYLKRLPAFRLKIDQGFVRDMLDDPDDLAVLEGVLGLASAFQRQAIAEGVETSAHCEILLSLGCDLGQGYAIASPMPPEDIAGWLERWRPEEAWTLWPRVVTEDLPVLLAMVSHRAWVRSITAFLQGRLSVPPPMDVSQCRLGRWLANGGRAFDADVMARVEELHKAIHRNAGDLLDLKQRERSVAPGRGVLDRLHAQHDELQGLLQELLSGKSAPLARPLRLLH